MPIFFLRNLPQQLSNTHLLQISTLCLHFLLAIKYITLSCCGCLKHALVGCIYLNKFESIFEFTPRIEVEDITEVIWDERMRVWVCSGQPRAQEPFCHKRGLICHCGDLFSGEKMGTKVLKGSVTVRASWGKGNPFTHNHNCQSFFKSQTCAQHALATHTLTYRVQIGWQSSFIFKRSV